MGELTDTPQCWRIFRQYDTSEQSGRDRSTALRGGTKKTHLTFAISNGVYKVVQITLFSYIRAESKVLRNGYLA